MTSGRRQKKEKTSARGKAPPDSRRRIGAKPRQVFEITLGLCPRGVAPPWFAAGSYPPRDAIRQRTDDGREITDAKRQRTYPITDKRCVGEPRFITHHGREQIDAEEGNGSGGRSPPWSLVLSYRGNGGSGSGTRSPPGGPSKTGLPHRR